MSTSNDPPRISVVLPAYRAWHTLPVVLDALQGQVARSDREVVLVESSAEQSQGELTRRWPWVRFIALPERTLPGAARNIGVRAARGSLIAFLDADAVPLPGWLDQLERAVGPGVEAVGGAVLNGTPRSATGTAGYLLEFAEWFPRRRPPIEHAASCNLLVRREVLARAGGFREDVWPGEDTILTFGLARSGQLEFAPRAIVCHLNRTGLQAFVQHQRRLGVGFRVICETVEFPRRRLIMRSPTPLLAVLRLGALARQLTRDPRQGLVAAPLLPLLAVGATAWAAGVRS